MRVSFSALLPIASSKAQAHSSHPFGGYTTSSEFSVKNAAGHSHLRLDVLDVLSSINLIQRERTPQDTALVSRSHLSSHFRNEGVPNVSCKFRRTGVGDGAIWTKRSSCGCFGVSRSDARPVDAIDGTCVFHSPCSSRILRFGKAGSCSKTW